MTGYSNWIGEFENGYLSDQRPFRNQLLRLLVCMGYTLGMARGMVDALCPIYAGGITESGYYARDLDKEIEAGLRRNGLDDNTVADIMSDIRYRFMNVGLGVLEDTLISHEECPLSKPRPYTYSSECLKTVMKPYCIRCFDSGSCGRSFLPRNGSSSAGELVLAHSCRPTTEGIEMVDRLSIEGFSDYE